MSTNPEQWIGVAEVAAEMKWSERAAWEALRKSGVKMINHQSMRLSRFRRSDWEEAREACMKPISPRTRYVRPVKPAQTAPVSKPKPNPEPTGSKLAKIKSLKI